MEGQNIQEKEKTPFPWSLINTIVGILLFFNPLVLFQLTVIGISVPLGGALLLLCTIIRVLHRKYRRTGKCRNSMFVVRGVSIVLAVLYAATPMVIHSFEENRLFYQAKKYAYAYGVGNASRTLSILPDRLPPECEDYYMITQGAMIAQDYHPSIYLMFHTNEETMRKYESHMESLAEVKRHENKPPAPDDPYYIYYMDPDPIYESARCPYEFPMHVYSRVRRAGFTDSLGYAVIYEIPDYYNKGCMLNYETGLVVFWI